MKRVTVQILLIILLVLAGRVADVCALSSSNIPLESPIYHYLDKLAGFGLIHTDVKGLKPLSKAEAARLLLEAEDTLTAGTETDSSFARELINRIRELIPREVTLREHPEKKPPIADYNPVSSLRLRYVYLDGTARSYERQANDPGNDGVFGIGSGLRPKNPFPTPVQHHGTEGTPLMENNDGVIYRKGNNGELRWAVEGYVGDKAAAVVEPVLLTSDTGTTMRLNRGYLKIGGGSLELEAGRDENWLGFGYRGGITLTNNAQNLDIVKLSSPEPLSAGWLGDVKYALILSRLDTTTTVGQVRHPWFYAIRLLSKPTDNLEIGFNLGRQQGGPGVGNSLGDWIRGLVGGTGPNASITTDNSKANAGLDARYRIPWLRNSELYGEFSGCDAAAIWPIVESYLAGFYLPMLTSDGRNDLRFEYFRGNNILYTSTTFPEGYLYHGMPLGHSQGGAVEDFFVRYSHWFSVRNNVALEYFYTVRGSFGRLPGQAIEHKNAGRISWSLPLYGNLDAQFLYGAERIVNLNLVEGQNRTNQLATFELRYNY